MIYIIYIKNSFSTNVCVCVYVCNISYVKINRVFISNVKAIAEIIFLMEIICQSFANVTILTLINCFILTYTRFDFVC